MTPPLIRALHTAFETATGNAVALNHYRATVWQTWLQWNAEDERKGAWTEVQLREVVKYLRGEIGRGERRPASLDFRNLIERPDNFEKDLNLARQNWLRNRPRKDQAPRQVSVALADGSIINRLVSGAEIVPEMPREVSAEDFIAVFRKFAPQRENPAPAASGPGPGSLSTLGRAEGQADAVGRPNMEQIAPEVKSGLDV